MSTVHLCLHVPKCAGTTVEAHLARHLGPAFWSPDRRLRALPVSLMGRKYAMPPPVAPEGIRAVSGHWIGRSVERLFAGRAIRRSILLREPGALMLSWYNHRMARYAAAGRARYGFALHLASLPPDPVAHFLLERWLELSWGRLAAMTGAQKRRRLDALLAGFDFVGDVGECDRLIAWLARDLGVSPDATRANTAGGRSGTAPAPIGLADLSPAERAALERRTRLDRWLWQRWAAGRDCPLPAPSLPFLAGELARPLAELRRRSGQPR